MDVRVAGRSLQLNIEWIEDKSGNVGKFIWHKILMNIVRESIRLPLV